MNHLYIYWLHLTVTAQTTQYTNLIIEQHPFVVAARFFVRQFISRYLYLYLEVSVNCHLSFTNKYQTTNQKLFSFFLKQETTVCFSYFMFETIDEYVDVKKELRPSVYFKNEEVTQFNGFPN